MSNREMRELTPPQDHSHVPALDGVRGIAVLAILIGHTWVNPFPGNPVFDFVTRSMGSAWAGVDLFFVLSGFLITGILYRSVKAENYFRVFYFRRFLRIFPLYYGVLFALLLLTHPLHIEWKGRFWILLLYLQNAGVTHHFFSEGFSPYLNLSHFWSLAVEEQFYIVWPLIIFLLKDLRKLIPVAILFSVGALLLRVVLVARHTNPSLIYMSVATRADSLMIGALLAFLLAGSKKMRELALRAAPVGFAVSLLPLIIMGWHAGALEWKQSQVTSTIGYSFLAILFACLIAMSLSVRQARAVMSNTVLRWFGRYSYGIYVFHPIILASAVAIMTGLTARGSEPAPTTRALTSLVTIAVTLAVAFASYNLYEKRFLAMKGLMKYRFPQPEQRAVEAESRIESNEALPASTGD